MHEVTAVYSHLHEGRLGVEVTRLPVLAASAIAVVDDARATLRDERERQAQAKARADAKLEQRSRR